MIKKNIISKQTNGIWSFTYPEDVEMVVVSGDIHGAFRQIVNKVTAQYDIRNALLIVAGDCGFGFEKPGYYEDIYQRCAKQLKKNNIYVAFVRGNHDNPEYFNQRIIDKSRWATIPDYSIIRAAGKNILCIGGAISVDRQYRFEQRKPINSARHYNGPIELKPNIYWANECVVYDIDKLDEISKQASIDTVITHTSPTWCEITNHDGLSDFSKNDPTLIEDVINERHQVDLIYEYLIREKHPIKNWLYGHFHRSWNSEIDGIKFSLLDCEELRELR